MNVRILLFAQMRLDHGSALVPIELPDGATVEHAIVRAAAQHPAIARHLASCLIAVGLDYVEPDHALKDGDEISLIPPVQGG